MNKINRRFQDRLLFQGMIVSASYLVIWEFITKHYNLILFTSFVILIYLIVLYRSEDTIVWPCFFKFITFSFETKREQTIVKYGMIAFFLIAAISNSAFTSKLPYWYMDNGAFIGRYVNLYHSFPSLSYYDPFWQGGNVTYESFRSGITALFLIFYPFILPENIDFSYRFIAPIIMFSIPCMIFAGTRLIGLENRHALCAAAFSLIACTQENWFSPVNGLKAGIYPFILTSSLFPIIIGIGLSLLEKRITLVKGLSLLFLVTLTALSHPVFLVMVAGPLAGLMFWFALKGISKGKKFTKNSFIFLITACGMGSLVVVSGNFEIIIHLFTSAIEVIKSNREPFTQLVYAISLEKKEFIEKLGLWISPRFSIFIPVLIFGSLQIYYWVKNKSIRGICFLFSAGWLLILGWFGSFFLYGTQPVRFVTPAALLLLVPFSELWCRSWNSSFISQLSKKKYIAFSSSLLIIICNVCFFSGNLIAFVESVPSRAEELQTWLRFNSSANARIIIDLDGHNGIGGMPKRLQQITGRHFIGEQAFNPKHRRELKKIMYERFSYDYFNTYNVHLLLVTTKEAQEYVEKTLHLIPEKTFGPVKVYRTGIDSSSSFFIKGKGDIKVVVNRFDIDLLSQDDEEVVIRFHYEKGMYANEGVELFPVANKYNKKFIGIKPNGVEHIEIYFHK